MANYQTNSMAKKICLWNFLDCLEEVEEEEMEVPDGSEADYLLTIENQRNSSLASHIQQKLRGSNGSKESFYSTPHSVW